ncbi:hypothetical protein ACJX0J_037118, partial [Zea mays]
MSLTGHRGPDLEHPETRYAEEVGDRSDDAGNADAGNNFIWLIWLIMYSTQSPIVFWMIQKNDIHDVQISDLFGAFLWLIFGVIHYGFYNEVEDHTTFDLFGFSWPNLNFSHL